MFRPRVHPVMVFVTSVAAVACADRPRTTAVLTQHHAIRLHDNAFGLRDVADAAVTPAGELLVIDGLSRRLRVLSANGGEIKRVRLDPLTDNALPTLIAISPGRNVYLFSNRSSDCRILSRELESFRDCRLPVRFTRVVQALFIGDDLVILGRRPGSSRAAHAFKSDLTPIKSFARFRRVRWPTDSATLRWGLGFAAKSGKDMLVYAWLNPFVLTRYSIGGRRLPGAARGMRIGLAEDTVLIRRGQRVIADVFERSLGIVSVGEYVLYFLYGPARDETTVLLVDSALRVRSHARLPFYMKPLAAYGDVLYVLRDINGEELVKYTVEVESETPGGGF